MPDLTDISATQVSEPPPPRAVGTFIYGAFFWSMAGVALIYGFRLYQDAPIHPSFIPIIGGSFAAIVSFTLIMTLRIVVGPISIKADKYQLEGATGPIIVWCICFITICFGLYLLGIADTAKTPPSLNYYSCSALDAAFGKCSFQRDAVHQTNIVAQNAASAAHK
jgi:hypothetical protein